MRKFRWMTGILLWICLTLPVTVWADDGNRVVDQADLLSDQEEQMLGKTARELSEKWNQDFVLVTTSDTEGKTAEEYADDYYEEHHFQKNGVLYLIDMDNREVWVSTSGAMIRFLTDYRIELVIDAGYEELKAGNYADCLQNMMAKTENFLEEGIPDHQYTYDVETGKITRYRSVTRGEFFAALAAAAVCCIIFVIAVNSSYKMKHGKYSYPFQDKGRLKLIQKEDHFVNQVVTRRKIQKDTSSGSSGSGRSSVHTSSGGHSHGGGGRKF